MKMIAGESTKSGLQLYLQKELCLVRYTGPRDGNDKITRRI